MQNVLAEISNETNNIQRQTFTTPKRTQQDIILAYRSSQRKQSISESRQKIQSLVQIQHAKMDHFTSLVDKLRDDPSDLIYNQMIEFFNNEKEDINYFAEGLTRGIIIDETYDQEYADFFNKILMFMTNLDLVEEKLRLVKALFLILKQSKDPGCHINCLRLLIMIFKRNPDSLIRMRKDRQKYFFQYIFGIDALNQPKILKLLSKLCLVLKDGQVKYNLTIFRSKIFPIFNKAIETKNLRIINGILFLLDQLENKYNGPFIDCHADDIINICLEKIDLRDSEQCDSVFEILGSCTNISKNKKYEFIQKYLEFLQLIDDPDMGASAVSLILWELMLFDVYENTALKHLYFVSNILLWTYQNLSGYYQEIKNRVKGFLELLRIRPNPQEIVSQDQNLRIKKITLIYQKFYSLL
ncbi:hypothetical protein pb186bvf_018144 [Paramecium bursaria]